jgi:tRNA(Ile)-lysidine synthase
VLKQLQRYIHEHELLRPGERVAIAVSGGADSVALLRLLLELREELGIVLAVAHVNHLLRGADAERDVEFVAELAERHGLEFHLAVRDVGAYAVEHKLSLEAAGRRVRYAFFRLLIDEGKADKVATAHTLDDQAETVLLKLLRGSWLRGLAGIHPRLRAEDGRVWVVRPLLGTSRRELEAYLERLGQPWREDLSNQDRRFRRNRVRQLLPLLEAEHNPEIRAALAQTAELARAEESYWAEKIAEIAPELILHSAPTGGIAALAENNGTESLTIDSELLARQPLALQRRLLRFAGEQVGLQLGFEEVERLRRLLSANGGSRCELPTGWEARKRRSLKRSSLQIFCPGAEPKQPTKAGEEAGDETRQSRKQGSGYEYRFQVPGELQVAEAGRIIQVRLVEVGEGHATANLINPKQIEGELTVRNWRPGDRYHPLGDEREKKLKVYFQQYRIPPEERTMWPLVFSNGRLVWAAGMPVASAFAFQENTGVAFEIEGKPIAG